MPGSSSLSLSILVCGATASVPAVGVQQCAGSGFSARNLVGRCTAFLRALERAVVVAMSPQLLPVPVLVLHRLRSCLRI